MQTVIQRGHIYNLARYRQVINFAGLQFERNITPTDIDGVLDFGGKFFVLIELKHSDAPLPYGQRLCLERLCQRLRNDSDAAVIVSRHDCPPEEPVLAAETIVSEYLWQGKWLVPQQETSLRAGIELLKFHIAKVL